MKKKFAKKRERSAIKDVNQNAIETQTKKAFLKPQDWGHAFYLNEVCQDCTMFLCATIFILTAVFMNRR